LNLARDEEGSKKDFYKCISCKRKTKDNTDMLTTNPEKPKVLGAFFTLVFTDKTTPHKSHAPQTCEKVRSKQRRIKIQNAF